ncbi:hypothetical protein ACIQWV_27990 [Streptomyces sp. NPDC098085]|uniref:hypothetical protein n=1 Tax=unclassified Streptomyces TaxID=2593676 RepID=UPI0037F8F27C
MDSPAGPVDPLPLPPGTKRVTRVEQNAGALDVELDPDALPLLDALTRQVAGARY